jgi:hypothetical protein
MCIVNYQLVTRSLLSRELTLDLQSWFLIFSPISVGGHSVLRVLFRRAFGFSAIVA